MVAVAKACVDNSELEVSMAPPPGLFSLPGIELEGGKPPYDACSVRLVLSGIPNVMCSEEMVEAMLDQAGLERFTLGRHAKIGKKVGEVHLTLVSWDAAAMCMAHFNGCKWDQSGHAVNVKVLEEESIESEAAGLNVPEAECEAAAAEPLLVITASSFEGLSGVDAHEPAKLTIVGETWVTGPWLRYEVVQAPSCIIEAETARQFLDNNAETSISEVSQSVMDVIAEPWAWPVLSTASSVASEAGSQFSARRQVPRASQKMKAASATSGSTCSASTSDLCSEIDDCDIEECA